MLVWYTLEDRRRRFVFVLLGDIKLWNLLGSRCGLGRNRIADTRRILKLEKEG
jgi:hypothetical protein